MPRPTCRTHGSCFWSQGCDWEAAVRAHGEVFGSIRPANTTYFVAGFIPDVLVEVELEAIVQSVLDELGLGDEPPVGEAIDVEHVEDRVAPPFDGVGDDAPDRRRDHEAVTAEPAGDVRRSCPGIAPRIG